MKSYAQNKEDIEVQKWFGDYVGTLLSIGENTGTHLSNALALIEKGFEAVLVEPAPKAFDQLQQLHALNEKVFCVNSAISNYNGKADFYDSGTHLNIGDTSLLSSLDEQEIKRWGNTTEFNKIEVEVIDFKRLLDKSPLKKFDFISIDAEGNDLIILRQMDLKALECKLICIEHNGNQEALQEIRSICSDAGLNKELLINAENIILSHE